MAHRRARLARDWGGAGVRLRKARGERLLDILGVLLDMLLLTCIVNIRVYRARGLIIYTRLELFVRHLCCFNFNLNKYKSGFIARA